MSSNQENSLKLQVYHALFSDIIKGMYPFDYIFTEKFLIDKYKVSRAPVREALTMMTENKILVSIPRQGYKFMQPSEGKLFEIVKFRSALECSFLENNHCYIKKADIDSLWELCDRYDAIPPSESITRWSTNCEFHLKLFTTLEPQFYDIREGPPTVNSISSCSPCMEMNTPGPSWKMP